MVDQYYFSGGVPEDNSTYVTRHADEELYKGLKAGTFCYVLNSSQSGKTSLRIRTMRRLREDGVKCAAIDLSGGGIDSVSSQEQWYKGLVDTLSDYLGLDVKEEWWEQNQSYSFVTRFGKFIQKILLAQIKENIVIFIDEIGTVLSLKFPTDDFFASIRYCYQQRVDNPEYKRLTFCLLGIASPGSLVQDINSTPFNIGKAVYLKPFQLGIEVEPLNKGLQGKYSNPDKVIEEILYWTGGQPFLTQKLCHLMVLESQSENPRSVEQVVRERIIEDWEYQDEPQHLLTIRNRILKHEKLAPYLLILYRRVQSDGIIADNTLEQHELQLSGLVDREKNKLRVYNRIYQEIFDKNWIETELWKLCPYAEDLKDWVASGYKDKSRLLRGNKLQEAIEWSKDKSLSDQHTLFFSASKQEEDKLALLEIEAELERQRKDKEAAEQRNQALDEANDKLATANYTLTEANKKAKRRIRVGSIILVGAVISVSWAVFSLIRIQKQLNNISTLSALIKTLQDNNKPEKAAEATKQLGLSQDQEIKENYDLQQALLLSDIALAYQNLEQPQDARTAIEQSRKSLRNGDTKNSPIEKEVLIHSLNIQGAIYKNKNKQIATEAYKEAFDLLQLNSDQFNPLNLETKIITFDTIKSVHHELIELLNIETAQNNNFLSQVKESQKKYFYAELNNLLENNNLKAADNLTAEIIWELAGKWEERSFRAEDSQKFSCEDLRAIDNLWTKYSDQRFGFSVQSRIWREVNPDIIKFMSRVGWGDQKQEDGRVIIYFYPVTDFSLNAPKGQLPWLVTWEGSDGLGDRTAYLNKITSCGI